MKFGRRWETWLARGERVYIPHACEVGYPLATAGAPGPICLTFYNERGDRVRVGIDRPAARRMAADLTSACEETHLATVFGSE